VLDELVDQGEDYGVGGSLDHEAGPRGQGQEDAGGQHEKQGCGGEQIREHFYSFARKKTSTFPETPSGRVHRNASRLDNAC
jgi:hypothetical protein